MKIRVGSKVYWVRSDGDVEVEITSRSNKRSWRRIKNGPKANEVREAVAVAKMWKTEKAS